MLSQLSISNLATIQQLRLDLPLGFLAFTGETGAGKSMLVNALRFVMGGAGGAEKLRNPDQDTQVAAVFDLAAAPDARSWLESLKVPVNGQAKIQRTLSANGRSRATVNDNTISQTNLETLGSYLVSIHGQHDNQLLLRPRSHVDFLDAFASLMPLRKQVKTAHQAYTKLMEDQQTLNALLKERDLQQNLLEQTIADIQAASPLPDDENTLRSKHQRLLNAEQLHGSIAQADSYLYQNETNVLQALQQTQTLLHQAQQLDPSLKQLASQLEPLCLQVQELHHELTHYLGKLASNPAELEILNEQLASLEKINRRYGSLPKARQKLSQAQTDLDRLQNADKEQAQLEHRILQQAQQLHQLSRQLSQARKDQAQQLSHTVNQELRELGMKHAQFRIDIQVLKPAQADDDDGKPRYSPRGMDAIEFLLSPNPGLEPRPLSRIASGGELSRVMLALKTALARADFTHTLIFDEIDSGISGSIAQITGSKLRQLGSTHQVLCVTHLPQIAAQGQQHFLVEKHIQHNQTFSSVRLLNPQEKVLEIARLLSGVNITQSSQASAQELIAASSS